MLVKSCAAIIDTALAILGQRFVSQEAKRLLIAMALQESNLQYRKQIGGPARGLWQFEKGGGVRGVLKHHSVGKIAEAFCREMNYEPDEETIYQALADNDILAAGFARLFLFTDPKAVPTTAEEGWECYLRTWRPGKPHPQKWARNWQLALEAVP